MPEPALEIRGLTKSFGAKTVVDDVSFRVERGEIFGFLGPNGSGKTTTIRTMLGIIRQDSGSARVLGAEPDRELLNCVGYLPQDRGLTKSSRVLEVVRYLGRLKGMSKEAAQSRAEALLERMSLSEHRDKKIEQLSGGMAQMVQFAATIVHDPELIILDEPFSGLDPLNVELMKGLLAERQAAGATVMFSTHIMSDVEEMCRHIALISDAELLLFGDLAEIRRSRAARSVEVEADSIPDALRSLGERRPGGMVEYPLRDGRSADDILRAHVEAGIPVSRFEVALPSLNDIFVEEVTRARGV